MIGARRDGGPHCVSVVLELLGEVEKEADQGHDQYNQKAAYGQGKAEVAVQKMTGHKADYKKNVYGSPECGLVAFHPFYLFLRRFHVDCDVNGIDYGVEQEEEQGGKLHPFAEIYHFVIAGVGSDKPASQKQAE